LSYFTRMDEQMVTNSTVHVIRHLAFEDLGSFASILHRHGFEIQYHEAGVSDLTLLDPDDDSLLVVLGGPISVNDHALFAFINDEINLLKARIAADKPTLGICLGAQLLASAAGASIYPGHNKEIGWYPLQLTVQGEQSALKYLSARHCSVLHWHGETFDLPAAANLLASTERYQHQAFSLGKRILALQFHPEVTLHGMEQWFIGHIGEIMQAPGMDVITLRQDTRQYANQLEVQGELFFEAWLNEVLDD
jgi:GMP synthase (glutamine-hydrolysing)